MGADRVVQRDDGTPMGPTFAKFFISGIPGPGVRFTFMKLSSARGATFFVAASQDRRPIAGSRFLRGCSTARFVAWYASMALPASPVS
jgi:hypothetical protein